MVYFQFIMVFNDGCHKARHPDTIFKTYSKVKEEALKNCITEDGVLKYFDKDENALIPVYLLQIRKIYENESIPDEMTYHALFALDEEDNDQTIDSPREYAMEKQMDEERPRCPTCNQHQFFDWVI